MRIGVISDTHGLLRPEAVAALNGSDLIIHAGDVGARDVLEALQTIAPTIAVRGNVDTSPWAQALAETEVVLAGGLRAYVIHQIRQFDKDPVKEQFDAVIYGHSHKPSIEWRDGVLFLDPGSAGPRRFKLPVTLALVDISGGKLQAQIVDLGQPLAPA